MTVPPERVQETAAITVTETDRAGLTVDWSRPYQMGVVVADLARAQAFFELLGVGPFERVAAHDVVSREIFGRAAPPFEHDTARARLGASMEIVLIQPAPDDSPQRRALEERGDHLFHLCFHSEDIDREGAMLEERGFPAVSRGAFADGGRYAVFDTTAIGGVHFELFQRARARDDRP